MLYPYQMGDEGWNWLYEDGCREEGPFHIGTEGHMTAVYCPQQREIEA